MEELADLVPSLRNVVARPGTFADFFPETTEDDLIAVLVDGLAECHMEGLLLRYEADEAGTLTPALTSGQGALVLLFAGVRLIRAELFNRATSRKYVASSASFEEIQATNILRDIMRELKEQKARVVDAQATGGSGHAFFMADQYLARLSVAQGW